MNERLGPKIVVTGAVLAGTIGGTLVSAENVAAHGPDESPAPTNEADESKTLYTVLPGDTLYGIAQSYGLTLDELLSSNIALKENPEALRADSTLVIPRPERTYDMVMGARAEGLLNTTDAVRAPAGVSARAALPNYAATSAPNVVPRDRSSGLTLPQQVGKILNEAKDTLLSDINAGINELLGKPQIPDSLRREMSREATEDLGSHEELAGFRSNAPSVLSGIQIEQMPDGTIRINIGSGTDDKNTPFIDSPSTEKPSTDDGSLLDKPVVNDGPVSVPSEGISYPQYLTATPVARTPERIERVKQQTDGIQDQHEKVAARMDLYKEHAEWLFSSFTPTRAGYEAFVRSGINQEYTDVFGNKRPLDQNKTIDPSCTVVHWMAGRPESVEDFAAQMTHNVQAALMPGGRLYQVAPKINSLTWHAAGANNTCVGIEVWGFDSLDWDPAMAETLTYWLMYLHDTYDMPFERDIEAIEQTPLDVYGDYTPSLHMLGHDYGHKEVDRLLATNPVGKIDPSTFTMNLLYKKVLELSSILEAAPIVPEDDRQGSGGGILDAPIVEDADRYPSEPEGEVIAFSEQVEALLSPTARNYVVRTPEEALELSRQDSLSMDEAFGDRLTPGDVYIFHRMAGFSREQAWIMTAIAGRESSWRPGAVGDIASGQPSYGMDQIRYLGVESGPHRDPRANLDPRLAAINAYEIYKQVGFQPWESYELSGELTVENVFEAVRLKHRNNSADWERNLLHHVEEMFRELPAIEDQFEALVGAST